MTTPMRHGFHRLHGRRIAIGAAMDDGSYGLRLPVAASTCNNTWMTGPSHSEDARESGGPPRKRHGGTRRSVQDRARTRSDRTDSRQGTRMRRGSARDRTKRARKGAATQPSTQSPAAARTSSAQYECTRRESSGCEGETERHLVGRVFGYSSGKSTKAGSARFEEVDGGSRGAVWRAPIISYPGATAARGAGLATTVRYCGHARVSAEAANLCRARGRRQNVGRNREETRTSPRLSQSCGPDGKDSISSDPATATRP